MFVSCSHLAENTINFVFVFQRLQTSSRAEPVQMSERVSELPNGDLDSC